MLPTQMQASLALTGKAAIARCVSSSRGNLSASSLLLLLPLLLSELLLLLLLLFLRCFPGLLMAKRKSTSDGDRRPMTKQPTICTGPAFKDSAVIHPRQAMAQKVNGMNSKSMHNAQEGGEEAKVEHSAD